MGTASVASVRPMTRSSTTSRVLLDVHPRTGEWIRWFASRPPALQGAKLPARIPDLKVPIAVISEA